MKDLRKSRLWPELAVGAGLYALLAINIGVAYIPVGATNTTIAVAIAVTMAALVAAFFMDLRRAPALILLVAAVGPLWLGVLLLLTMSDLVTR